MKTEIRREYRWGFVLGEQEVRRLAQTCRERGEKLHGAPVTVTIAARLADGAVVETSDIENVLGLENAGKRRVDRLTLAVRPFPQGENLIELSFQNGVRSPKRWISIEMWISGRSRDEVFLAASDLEDRIQRTKIIPWAHLSIRELTFSLTMFSLACLPTVVGFFKSRSALEETRAIHEAVTRQAPFLLALGACALLAWLLPAYNFCWGDYVPVFERRRSYVRFLSFAAHCI